MSNIVSRRQLHSNKKEKKEVEYNSVFVEQKNRLKKHLNSIPVIYIDKSDLFNNASKIRTRKENKKQKKINTLLKDMYIDKNISAPLAEDTNLKLLKNLSLNKSYDTNKRQKENYINISNNIISNSIKNKEYKKDNDHLVDLITEVKPKKNSVTFGSIPVINKNLKEDKEITSTSIDIKTGDIDLMNKKIDYLEQKLEKLSQKNNKKQNILSYDDKSDIYNCSLKDELILEDTKEKDIKLNNKSQNFQRNIRDKNNDCKDKYLNISIIILSIIFLLLLFLIFILFMQYKNLTI